MLILRECVVLCLHTWSSQDVCCLWIQTDPLILNPVGVFKVLESLAPDVNEDSIESVSEEIGLMGSITLEDLLPILSRCGITSAQCMRMRRTLEAGVCALLCVHVW